MFALFLVFFIALPNVLCSSCANAARKRELKRCQETLARLQSEYIAQPKTLDEMSHNWAKMQSAACYKERIERLSEDRWYFPNF